jgi:hypothetical protein
MNTKLLEKTIKSIEEEPRRLDMKCWAKKVNPNNDANPPCGTKACIAGHVAFVNRKLYFYEFNGAAIKNFPGIHIDTYAQEALKLDSDQAGRLFYFKNWNDAVGWPRKFSVAYNKAKTAKQRAKVAVARIRHFIATKGQE